MSHFSSPPKFGNKITGLAPLSLTRCRLCRANKDKIESYNYLLHGKEFPWAFRVICSDPTHPEWIVCNECPIQRTGMTSRDQLHRHMKTRHATSSKKRTKKSFVSDTNLSVNQMITNNIPVIEAPKGEAFQTDEE